MKPTLLVEGKRWYTFKQWHTNMESLCFPLRKINSYVIVLIHLKHGRFYYYFPLTQKIKNTPFT